MYKGYISIQTILFKDIKGCISHKIFTVIFNLRFKQEKRVASEELQKTNEKQPL